MNCQTNLINDGEFMFINYLFFLEQIFPNLLGDEQLSCTLSFQLFNLISSCFSFYSPFEAEGGEYYNSKAFIYKNIQKEGFTSR